MLANEQLKVGLLLLAAGEASRMGMPKQLLVYQSRPLIRHMIHELLALGLPLTVVLGARAAMIEPVISDFPVTIVINPAWKAGMGSSLKAGLRSFAETHPHLEAVLCCVVDQPFLSTALLLEYLAVYEKVINKGDALIAAHYQNGTIGVPALLGTTYIHEVYKQEDAIGARKLLRKYADDLLTIAFPSGDFDLDNLEDWEKYRQM